MELWQVDLEIALNQTSNKQRRKQTYISGHLSFLYLQHYTSKMRELIFKEIFVPIATLKFVCVYRYWKLASN